MSKYIVTSYIDPDELLTFKGVEKILKVQEPYKKANRLFHPEPTIVDVNGTKVGGGHLGIMAGPCSVESEEQVVEIAKAVKKSGANFLRGGAFKPRTSPYAFRGLKAKGLELLLMAKKETGLPIVTELMSLEHLDLFNDVDIIQIGARNMQNFDLLKEVGKCKKPILLKRGLANTIEEFRSYATRSKTGRVSSLASPITTGTLCLIIPAFSAAILASVSPRNMVWSRLILVMTDIIGVMILVQSRRPPKPTSIMAISTFCSAKSLNARAVVSSKNEGYRGSKKSRSFSTKSITYSSSIHSPLTRMRSRKSTRCGDV